METKKDILDNLELRSEGVQDVLTRPPHWMIRWGNTVVLIILLMILVLSYFIKYPEFVPAPVVITSQNPPEKLEARTNSRIEKILVEDHQQVKKGDVMMVLESTANYLDVLKLREMIDESSSSQNLSFPLSEASKLKLGELQSDYNTFAKAYQDEKLFSRLQPYAPENTAANQSIAETRARIANLQQQRKTEVAKYHLTQKNFKRSQDLYNQGVIPSVELENERIKLLQAQQSIEGVDISLSQLNESISGLQRTKSGAAINTEKDRVNYSSTSVQMFENLRKSLNQWIQTYLIESSTNGTVSFQQFWGENQFVKSGDVVLSILPNNKKNLVGRMTIPSLNSGKVVSGQKVLIKLDNYRYQEFGIVEGKVQHISLTPDKDGNYFVEIILPKGLQTSYDKTLLFDKELKGNAEIVTEDLRLIERFFFQIRELLGYQ